jgi:rhodanese-related sulfurtransferase
VAVGIDNVAGFLRGGMQTWRALNLPTESLERIDVPTLHIRRQELQVLDVRELQEWDEGHIPGSVHLPYHDVNGIPDGIDPARPVAVICASGQRSAVAASLLALHGAAHVIHVAGGGVGTWERNGWPVTQAQTSATA